MESVKRRADPDLVGRCAAAHHVRRSLRDVRPCGRLSQTIWSWSSGPRIYPTSRSDVHRGSAVEFSIRRTKQHSTVARLDACAHESRLNILTSWVRGETLRPADERDPRSPDTAT